MKSTYLWSLAILMNSCLYSAENLSPAMLKIMDQPKYEHAMWGLYAKDLITGEVLYDINSNKMFSPASTSKLFSVEALLQAFGDDYRFKTPVMATAPIVNGEIKGNLILQAQGDLTFGGRQANPNMISFTKMDHIVANDVPGVILTKEDPLAALNDLAKQIYQKGVRVLTGDVLIDDSLFETIEKRGMTLSPIMINENLIDFVINPTSVAGLADIKWRPQIAGYSIENQLVTGEKNSPLAIEIKTANSGKTFILKGSIPIGKKDIVRTAPIVDPKAFARSAFIQSLQNQGITVNISPSSSIQGSENHETIALFVSPPLTEYAKLILKVSHNLGADLVPLLLASKEGKKTFNEGMLLLGDFIKNQAKLQQDAFVMIDAAGGNENRFTPEGELKLLSMIQKQPKEKFQHYFDALPILGVDGSLEDFAKNSPGVGKVRAKPGTGVALNLATGQLFLITQALAGYIEGKNGHLIGYMLVVNNGKMPTVDDIYAIFEDLSQFSSLIYESSANK